MRQSAFAASLAELVPDLSPAESDEVSVDRLSSVAASVLSGLGQPLGADDIDQVQRCVYAAMTSGEADQEQLLRPAAAALLAVGLARDAAVQDVLAALAVARTAASELFNVLSKDAGQEPGHVLPIAVAVGVSRLLGADAERMSHAVGIASSMTVATRGGTHTGPAEPLLVALCCGNGVLAAYLASRGFTAAPRALEGRRGWVATLDGAPPDSECPSQMESGAAAAPSAQDKLRSLYSDLATALMKDHAND